MLTDVAPKYDPKFFLQNFSFINNYRFVDDVEISVSIFLDRLGIEKTKCATSKFSHFECFVSSLTGKFKPWIKCATTDV